MRCFRVVAFALTLASCASGGKNDTPPPGPATIGMASTGSDTLSDTEVEVMMSSTGSDAPDETTSSGPPPAGSSDGGDNSSTAAVEGTSSGGSPAECIEEVGDIVCLVCIKQNCCGEYETCLDDGNCTCAIDCIKAGGMAQDCANMCGSSEAVTGIVICGSIACDADCSGI